MSTSFLALPQPAPPVAPAARPASRGAPIVEAQAVTKRYGQGIQAVDAVRGVSLGLMPGEIVALEGPSGSGKTTLLSILGCILTPTSGHVRVADEVVETATPARLAAVRRRLIGFVFQQFNLFPALTALENVTYALGIRGRRRQAPQRAQAALEAVGLGDRLHFLPRDLSGGQKQRVAVARAIAGDPPIVLADEPTANLDSASSADVLALLKRLARERGHALFIVTHDVAVRTIADRVLVIRDGRLQP